MTAADIIAAARAEIGTPFVHQGRLSGVALDCAGLIVQVATALGLDYVDVPGYSRTPSGGILEAALDAQPCLERVAEAEAGDVLLFRFTGAAQHLGITTGENLIHAYQKVGKVCEHRIDTQWQRRIVRIYRFKGLVNE